MISNPAVRSARARASEEAMSGRAGEGRRALWEQKGLITMGTIPIALFAALVAVFAYAVGCEEANGARNGSTTVVVFKADFGASAECLGRCFVGIGGADADRSALLESNALFLDTRGAHDLFVECDAIDEERVCVPSSSEVAMDLSNSHGFVWREAAAGHEVLEVEEPVVRITLEGRQGNRVAWGADLAAAILTATLVAAARSV